MCVLRLADGEVLGLVSPLMALLVFGEEVRVTEEGVALLPAPLKSRYVRMSVCTCHVHVCL